MSERTEVSFDAALMMALRADAQKELDELPSPAQLKERYPDTSRWDARLQAALHKRRPVLKRVLIAVLTLVILTLGALAVSAEFRRAVYTMIQKFLPIEMQLTYQMDGEPLEQLPNGYTLNQSDFKKGFQFINISFQKKLLLTFVLMNFSDHLHNFRSKQLFWLFYIIKSSHVIYLISELSTSFYSKMTEISMG